MFLDMFEELAYLPYIQAASSGPGTCECIKSHVRFLRVCLKLLTISDSLNSEELNISINKMQLLSQLYGLKDKTERNREKSIIEICPS